jgi:hypothetical protein
MKKVLTITSAIGVITLLATETSWSSTSTGTATGSAPVAPTGTGSTTATKSTTVTSSTGTGSTTGSTTVTPTGTGSTTVQTPAIVPNPGLDYVNNVVTQLGTALIPDYNILATVIAAYVVPTDPNVDAATVCLEQTSNGRIYRLHSKNPAANGIVTNPSDLAAFNWNFFSLNKGDPVNFSVSSDVSNPASPAISYTGKVVAKNGNAICFARYLKQ